MTILLIAVLALLTATRAQNLGGLVNDAFGQGENTGGDTEQVDCECVPYYLCVNGTIVKNGVGLIDIRPTKTAAWGAAKAPRTRGARQVDVRRRPPDGPCENYLDVCCAPPNRLPTPSPPPPPLPTPHPGDHEEHGDHGGHQGTTPQTPPRVRDDGCGQRHPDGVGFRITGAENGEAQFGEFPWMVAVLHEEAVGENPDEKLNVYKCGGALIHPQIVLTAAHCVHETPSGLKIRAGEWDTQTKNEVLPHQDRVVANVAVHPHYAHDSLYNDVALLFLEQPVELAENVDVVCLPQPGQIVEHGNCFASGWGKDVFGKEGRYQVILKRVEVPMVPRSNCIERLRKTRLGSYFELHESFVCAGGEPGKDTCKGDGGGPLVCPLAHDSTRYQQVGIVAWGIGCGDDTPAVYANVAHEREWIDRTVAANNFDPRYYTY